MKEPITIKSPTETEGDINELLNVLVKIRAGHWDNERSTPAVIVMHPRKWYGFLDTVNRSIWLMNVIRRDSEGGNFFRDIPVITSHDLLREVIMLF